MGKEVPKSIEAPGIRGEIRVEGVERRPVDRQARCLDLGGHRLEIRLQGPSFVQGGQVPQRQQRATGSHEEQEDETRPKDEGAPETMTGVTTAFRGRGGPGWGSSSGSGGLVAHGAGTAMTTKRGAVAE